jgi:hypothetical protein
MHSAKIVSIYVFLLLFASSTFAQENPYPNELKGYEFFRSGRLKDLKPLVSTRADVKRVMGANCEYGCDYDENWEIGFAYIERDWSKTDNVGIYKAKVAFIGKLHDISFRPRHPIVLTQVDVFPQDFYCANGLAESDKFEYKCRVCIDAHRVIYSLSDETKSDGKLLVLERQLMNIGYLPSREDDDGIYALVEK